MATFESVESEVKDVEGIQVRVGTPSGLYRLEIRTVRSIDCQDAALFRNQFQLNEESQVPVRCFRSIGERNDAVAAPRNSDEFQHFICHNGLLRRLSNSSHPRGVFKYRNVEEAQQARESRAFRSVRESGLTIAWQPD